MTNIKRLIMLSIYGGTFIVLSGVIVGTIAASPLLILGKCAIVSAEALAERLRVRCVKANVYV